MDQENCGLGEVWTPLQQVSIPTLAEGEPTIAALVPLEHRGQVIEFKLATAHLGEVKTVDTILRHLSGKKVREDTKRYIQFPLPRPGRPLPPSDQPAQVCLGTNPF